MAGSAAGTGEVVTKSGSVRRGAAGQAFAAGGTIHGQGQIIRKNGEVVDFDLTSDPLTAEQAKTLNETHSLSEEK